jgi:hypothetical protein
VVALCDGATYNTSILQQYCWSRTWTPKARNAPSSAGATSFAYTSALTPVVSSVDPAVSYGGQTISIGGSVLADITTVQLIQKGAVQGLCTGVSASGGSVSCTVPSLAAGIYSLQLIKGNGELSVDPFKSGVVTLTATVTALSGNSGSLAGDVPLTVTVGGTGLALGPNNATANVVTIAGLPCPLIAVDSATQLRCTAPGINGLVLAEYWNLPINTQTLPDLLSYINPTVRRLEAGVGAEWGTDSPVPGSIQNTYWGGRFTFFFQASRLALGCTRAPLCPGGRAHVPLPGCERCTLL